MTTSENNNGSTLAWRAFGENVRGASHVRANTPNQDAISWQEGPENGLPLIIAVADGHGSPTYYRSDRGAKFAVEVAVQEMKNFFNALPKPLTNFALVKHLSEQLPKQIVTNWRKRVLADVGEGPPFTPEEWQRFPEEKRGKILADVGGDNALAYGATLLTVLVTSSFILYLQLGDGDILMVTEAGQVTKPVQGDTRLLANETTSLCSANAAHDFRKQFHILQGTAPALILLSTDGYANSFTSEDGFLQVGSDILNIMHRDGVEAVEKSIPEWLNKASEVGSGDDITLGVLCRLNAANKLDLMNKLTASQKKEGNGSINDNNTPSPDVPYVEPQPVAVTTHEESQGQPAIANVQADSSPQSAPSSAPVQENVQPPNSTQGEATAEQQADGSQTGNISKETAQAPVSQIVQEQQNVELVRSGLPIQVQQNIGRDTSDAQTQLVLIVSQIPGEGHYTTINDALKHATHGSLIKVQRGIYHEKLVIKQDVKLVAAEEKGSVTIVSTAPCLRITAQYAEIHRIEFLAQGRGPIPVGGTTAAVEIEEGFSSLQYCGISNKTSVGVFIHGTGTDPHLLQSDVYACEDQGVVISDNAKGRIEHCTIYNNKLEGIEIKKGADPYIFECEVRNGHERGIVVWKGGRGTIEACRVVRNCSSGIEIRDKGNLTIKKSRVALGEGAGIVIQDSGQATIQECIIERNAGIGIFVQGETAPIIQKCQLSKGKQHGIFVNGAVSGLIEDCQITEHALAGVVIQQPGKLIFRKCYIQRNTKTGIQVTQRGQGYFYNCTITNNFKCEVLVAKKSSLQVREGSIIHSTEKDPQSEREAAIWFIEESMGQIEQCQIHSDSDFGIRIENKAQLILQFCDIQSSIACVVISKKSKATLDNNTLRLNSNDKLSKPYICEPESTLFIDGKNVSPR